MALNVNDNERKLKMETIVIKYIITVKSSQIG